MQQAHRQQFKRLITSLNQLLEDVRKDYPDAEWYLDGTGNLNLMSGPSHEGLGAPRRDRILHSEKVRHSGGGDW